MALTLPRAPASRRRFLGLTVALSLAGVARAQSPQAPSDALAETIAETLASKLEHGYVFPAIGAKYAAALRAGIASHAYFGLSGPDLAKRLTADVQTIAPDKHLHVSLASDLGGRPGAGPPGLSERQRPPAIAESKWLAAGIALIAFNEFPSDAPTIAAVDKFMTEHATAKALIIDARTHRGGGLGEMNVMLPYLYSKTTTLVAMDIAQSLVDERGPPMADGPAMVKADAPKGVYRRLHVVTPNPNETRLFQAKVVYLTSKRTASAAEHLALAFKRTHRATLVGETTAGANHFGGFEPIGGGLIVFLPLGRTFDPDTGWDWEGVGVAPDVATPAAEALDVALKLASAS